MILLEGVEIDLGVVSLEYDLSLIIDLGNRIGFVALLIMLLKYFNFI
jgi:hypothetical protein